jgi:ADP-ribose pyrophosphatase YjhB (NUDIX family)
MASCSLTPALSASAPSGPAPLLVRVSASETEPAPVPLADFLLYSAKCHLQKIAAGIVIETDLENGVNRSDRSAYFEPAHHGQQLYVAVALVCVNRQHQLLLVASRDEPGRLVLPSTVVKLGETLDVACRRAARELLGQELPSWPAKYCTQGYYGPTRSGEHCITAITAPLCLEQPSDLPAQAYDDQLRARWVFASEVYADCLLQHDMRQANAMLMDALANLASQYRRDFEFQHNGCYESARSQCYDAVLFDLCHFECNTGLIHRNDTHKTATQLAEKLGQQMPSELHRVVNYF